MKNDLPSKTLLIRGHRWTMTLVLPVLIEQCTLADFKNIYKWMTEDIVQNREAFNDLNIWFSEALIVAERAWSIAQQEYTDGWKDDRRVFSHNEKARIRRENDRLSKRIKHTKRIYDRITKADELLEAHIDRYRINLF